MVCLRRKDWLNADRVLTKMKQSNIITSDKLNNQLLQFFAETLQSQKLAKFFDEVASITNLTEKTYSLAIKSTTDIIKAIYYFRRGMEIHRDDPHNCYNLHFSLLSQLEKNTALFTKEIGNFKTLLRNRNNLKQVVEDFPAFLKEVEEIIYDIKSQYVNDSYENQTNMH